MEGTGRSTDVGEVDTVLLEDHKDMEAGEMDLAVGKASYHHAAGRQLASLAGSDLRGSGLLGQDMNFCHLENFHPLELVDSSLGLDHQVEDIGCAGGLVRRPFLTMSLRISSR